MFIYFGLNTFKRFCKQAITITVIKQTNNSILNPIKTSSCVHVRNPIESIKNKFVKFSNEIYISFLPCGVSPINLTKLCQKTNIFTYVEILVQKKRKENK